MDLQLSCTHILRYWPGIPDQHRQPNRLYRRMRVGAAQRELSRSNGERFLAPGYTCVLRAEWRRRYRHSASQGSPCLIQGRRWVMVAWKISMSTTARVRLRMVYTWPGFFTTRGRSGFLSLRRATRSQPASTGGARGSWCLQVHVASTFRRGIQRNVDESIGTAVVS